MFLQLLGHVGVVLAENLQLVHAGVAEAVVPKFAIGEQLENVRGLARPQLHVQADVGELCDDILADWSFV